jgi:hypothetical protein
MQAIEFFAHAPRIIVNLPVPGPLGQPGKDPVIVQFSIDGATGWVRDTPMAGAKYMRFSVDNEVTYGAAILFSGGGVQGIPGLQGNTGADSIVPGPPGSLTIPGGGTARLSGGELQIYDPAVNGWRAIMCNAGEFSFGNPVS